MTEVGVLHSWRTVRREWHIAFLAMFSHILNLGKGSPQWTQRLLGKRFPVGFMRCTHHLTSHQNSRNFVLNCALSRVNDRGSNQPKECSLLTVLRGWVVVDLTPRDSFSTTINRIHGRGTGGGYTLRWPGSFLPLSVDFPQDKEPSRSKEGRSDPRLQGNLNTLESQESGMLVVRF